MSYCEARSFVLDSFGMDKSEFEKECSEKASYSIRVWVSERNEKATMRIFHMCEMHRNYLSIRNLEDQGACLIVNNKENYHASR